MDCNYLFRDIYVGWLGKCHDVRLFTNSPLYEQCPSRNVLAHSSSRNIAGKQLAHVVSYIIFAKPENKNFENDWIGNINIVGVQSERSNSRGGNDIRKCIEDYLWKNKQTY